MNGEANVGERFVDATTAVCIKRGWLVDTGRTGLYPNENPYKIYALSDDGVDAIASFLLDLRYKRIGSKAA